MPSPRLNVILSSNGDIRRELTGFISSVSEVTTTPPRLARELTETMARTGNVDGVLIFADEADSETIGLAKHVDTLDIPYMLALGQCGSAQVLFELASREFILISRDFDQIRATITRFLAYLADPSRKYRGPKSGASQLPGDIWVRQGYAERRISLNEIRSISADKDYAIIELPNASLLVRATLATLEDELNAQDFVRIHRSHIVPARRIREVRNTTRHSHQVRLENGEVFPVGKTYWPRLRKRFRSQLIRNPG